MTKLYLLSIGLDATSSFSLVYPQIYSFLTELLRNLKSIIKDSGVRIAYNIVLLHDNAECHIFPDGGNYSLDEGEVIKEMSAFEFYGGSSDGNENVAGMLITQIKTLSAFPGSERSNEIQKGILMFSDSLPSDKDEDWNFTSKEPGKFGNEGLRFAKIFTYTDEFTPKLRIVNHKGKLTENEYNTCEYSSLSVLLTMGEVERRLYAKEMANDILRAFSGL